MTKLGLRGKNKSPAPEGDEQELDLASLTPKQYAAEMRRRKAKQLAELRTKGREAAERVHRDRRLIEYGRFGLKINLFFGLVAALLYGRTCPTFKDVVSVDLRVVEKPTGVAVMSAAAWLLIAIGCTFFRSEWRRQSQQRKDFELQARLKNGVNGGNNMFAHIDNTRHSDYLLYFFAGMTLLFTGGPLLAMACWLPGAAAAEQHVAFAIALVSLVLIFLFVNWDMNRIVLSDYKERRAEQRKTIAALEEAEAEALRQEHEALVAAAAEAHQMEAMPPQRSFAPMGLDS